MNRTIKLTLTMVAAFPISAACRGIDLMRLYVGGGRPSVKGRGPVAAIALLLVASLMLTACADRVSQEGSDKIAQPTVLEGDAAASQTPQAALDQDYATLQAQFAALESDYTTLQAQQAALEKDYATSQARQPALEQERATLEARQAALERSYATLQAQQGVLEEDYAGATRARDVEAKIRDLRNTADIKFALASGAVQRFRQADWDPSFGPGLAATAMDRLDDFVEDAQEVTRRTRALGDEVPAEVRTVYDKSARLYEAKIQEALYLKQLVEGISAQHATESEIADAYYSCLVVTDELRSDWVSQLDQVVAHHQAGIASLSKAEEITPEVSLKFSEAVAELEGLIGQASSLKEDPVPLADAAADDDDHGDSISEATLAELPCSIAGAIDFVGDADYFAFQAEAGTAYVIETTGDFFVNLQSTQGGHVASGHGSFAYTATRPETLYVLVQNRSNRTGTYTLSISAPSDDHGNSVSIPSDDHGNSISKATAVQVPSTTDGVIEYVGDLDYFSFQAEAGTAYLVGAAGDFYVSLYNSEGRQLNSGQGSLAHAAVASETLYVLVQDRFRGTGSYAMVIVGP